MEEMIRVKLYPNRKILSHRTNEKELASYLLLDVANIPTKGCMTKFWADIINLIHNKTQTQDEKIHQDIKLSYKVWYLEDFQGMLATKCLIVR